MNILKIMHHKYISPLLDLMTLRLVQYSTTFFKANIGGIMVYKDIKLVWYSIMPLLILVLVRGNLLTLVQVFNQGSNSRTWPSVNGRRPTTRTTLMGLDTRRLCPSHDLGFSKGSWMQ
jgi:hypothetical protein